MASASSTIHYRHGSSTPGSGTDSLPHSSSPSSPKTLVTLSQHRSGGTPSTSTVRRRRHERIAGTVGSGAGGIMTATTWKCLFGLGVFSFVVMYVGMSKYVLRVQSPSSSSSSIHPYGNTTLGGYRSIEDAIAAGQHYYKDWSILFHSTSFTHSHSGQSVSSSGGGLESNLRMLTRKWVPSARSAIVAKPRSMGCYFHNETSYSFVGTERLDPNMIHLQYVSSRDKKTPRLQMTATDWETQLQIRDGSDDYEDTRPNTFLDEGKDCVAQYDWQEKSFPTCNIIMEVDMLRYFYSLPDSSSSQNLDADHKRDEGSSMVVHAPPADHGAKTTKWSWESLRLIAHGYWRDVWKLTEMLPRSTEPDLVVMKTMRYQHEITLRNYDRHRRDAVAMERLTSSQFVMDIYGACGNSGLFEFADGGSLTDSIWHGNDNNTSPWSSQERLVVAYQVASGIAQLHNMEKEGVAAIAHTDITPDQFIYVDRLGVYRLNDFNRCRFIGWNKRINETCPFHIGHNPGTFRSPEEYAYLPETEKVDVYSMGNVFYTILTSMWPFEGLSEKKVRKIIKDGERPPIPDTVLNSTDPYDRAMLHALEMCWVQEHRTRASARQVQEYITEALRELGVASTNESEQG